MADNLGRIEDKYHQEEKVVKNPNPSNYEIVDKNDKGDFLKFTVWDYKTNKGITINVDSSDYDLYKVGDICYSKTDTIPGYD